MNWKDGPESFRRAFWRRWRSKSPKVRCGAADWADAATLLECFRASGHKLLWESRVGAELGGLGRDSSFTWGGATNSVSVSMTALDGLQKEDTLHG